MTKLEKLKDDIENNELLWLEEFDLKTYLDYCPQDLYCGNVNCDIDSAIYDNINYNKNKIVGCRGISCETCWNKESE